MTSKAERLRRKRASRKMPDAEPLSLPVSDPRLERPAPLRTGSLNQEPKHQGPWGMTEKQEAAWGWFAALRRAPGGEGLKAARAQLTDDEYDILCERTGPFQYVGRRTGRSEDRVRELHLSALRKLVIYLATHDIAH